MTSTDEPQQHETVTTAPVGRLASISIDCPDPAALAGFYAALLALEQIFATPDGSFVALSNGSIAITLMRTDDHVAPTWPQPGQLQQMHLDIAVDDLEAAVTRAVELGARSAEHQPRPDKWRVLLDPAGHPFCLTTVTLD
jgi:hypothetical protein